MTARRLDVARAFGEERCMVSGVGPSRWVGISVGGLVQSAKPWAARWSPQWGARWVAAIEGSCDVLIGMGVRAEDALDEIAGA